MFNSLAGIGIFSVIIYGMTSAVGVLPALHTLLLMLTKLL